MSEALSKRREGGGRGRGGGEKIFLTLGKFPLIMYVIEVT